MNSQLINVLLLGAAFHLIFFSFQTSVFIQQTVVNSIKNKPEYNFTGDGYVSLCITYTVFAVSNWLAPSIIAVTGAKYGMLLGALTYALYSASFIQPTTWLFYSAAALIGLGAGPLWSAQGAYLAKNSDSETSNRNAAIFWSMLQSSMLFGNIFVYLAFNTQQTTISDGLRYLIYGVLTGVCTLGLLVLLCLRDTSRTAIISSGRMSGSGVDDEDSPKSGAWNQFVGALKLAKTPNMILLASSFLLTGQLLSFFTGVYGTSIGATTQFGLDAKKYIGLSGVFIGIGEIFGGSLFGLLGARFNKILRGDTVFVMGYMVTTISLVLIYLNLPADSSLAGSAKLQPLIEPRIWVAMLSSLLIGFGDSCFNTQIYSVLMKAYNDNSVAAFALFKFVQSTGSAIAFLYSTALNLHYQLYLLALVSSVATITFCMAEWRCQSMLESSESQRDIFAGVKENIEESGYRSFTATASKKSSS